MSRRITSGTVWYWERTCSSKRRHDLPCFHGDGRRSVVGNYDYQWSIPMDEIVTINTTALSSQRVILEFGESGYYFGVDLGGINSFLGKFNPLLEDEMQLLENNW